MKIYEIGTGYTPIPAQMGAATEIVVEELTRSFRKMGENVQIIDIAAEDRPSNDLPIIEVPVPKCCRGTDVKLGLMHKLKRVIYSVSLAFTLRRLLKNSEEQVVLHFHNQYNLFFFLKLTPAGIRNKAFLAYTNHSGIWRLPWEEIERTVKKRYFQEAECMKRADVVFVLNEETKHNAMEHLAIPEGRLMLINNGVNTDVYRPLTAHEKQKAKEQWGFSNCNVILQVGSVNENKGQLRTAENLLPLLKKDPSLVFAYVGGIVEEEYQQRIVQLARDNHLEGQIRYLGMIAPGQELNALYNTALLTVFPSVYEAFGLVVVESFSAGVPVLVNRNGYVHLGDGSIEFDDDRMGEVVERILLRASVERESRTQLCRQNAVRNYGWDRVSSEYISVFQNKVNEYA